MEHRELDLAGLSTEGRGVHLRKESVNPQGPTCDSTPRGDVGHIACLCRGLALPEYD